MALHSFQPFSYILSQVVEDEEILQPDDLEELIAEASDSQSFGDLSSKKSKRDIQSPECGENIAMQIWTDTSLQYEDQDGEVEMQQQQQNLFDLSNFSTKLSLESKMNEKIEVDFEISNSNPHDNFKNNDMRSFQRNFLKNGQNNSNSNYSSSSSAILVIEKISAEEKGSDKIKQKKNSCDKGNNNWPKQLLMPKQEVNIKRHQNITPQQSKSHLNLKDKKYQKQFDKSIAKIDKLNEQFQQKSSPQINQNKYSRNNHKQGVDDIIERRNIAFNSSSSSSPDMYYQNVNTFSSSNINNNCNTNNNYFNENNYSIYNSNNLTNTKKITQEILCSNQMFPQISSSQFSVLPNQNHNSNNNYQDQCMKSYYVPLRSREINNYCNNFKDPPKLFATQKSIQNKSDKIYIQN